VDKVLKAIEFAILAHHGQTRRNGDPYIVHPVRVAAIGAAWGLDEDMVCGLVLHDVIEDTEKTEDDIYNAFGATVTSYVVGLTHVSTPKDGFRAQRKKKDREFLATCCNKIKTMKVCDILDNMSDIRDQDPNFAVIWVSEKRLMLDEALVGADEELWNRCSRIVNNFLKENG